VRRQLHEHIQRLQRKAIKLKIPQVDLCEKCNTVLFDAHFQFPIPCLHTCLRVDLKAIPRIEPIPVPLVAPPGVFIKEEIIDHWTFPKNDPAANSQSLAEDPDDPVVEITDIDPIFQIIAYECAEMLDISNNMHFAANIQGIYWIWIEDKSENDESLYAKFTLYCWEEAKNAKMESSR
jgi:hypothetical protein